MFSNDTAKAAQHQQRTYHELPRAFGCGRRQHSSSRQSKTRREQKEVQTSALSDANKFLHIIFVTTVAIHF